jgi:hypothetical protein
VRSGGTKICDVSFASNGDGKGNKEMKQMSREDNIDELFTQQ